jgi:hypothetical protein
VGFLPTKESIQETHYKVSAIGSIWAFAQAEQVP